MIKKILNEISKGAIDTAKSQLYVAKKAQEKGYEGIDLYTTILEVRPGYTNEEYTQSMVMGGQNTTSIRVKISIYGNSQKN